MTGPEPVTRVVYTSVASRALDAEALRSLTMRARVRNAHRGITGVLLYRSGRFLQVLEGPADQVDDLLGAIARDPRHTDLELLDRRDEVRRCFRFWQSSTGPWAPEADAQWAEPLMAELRRARLGDEETLLGAVVEFARGGRAAA